MGQGSRRVRARTAVMVGLTSTLVGLVGAAPAVATTWYSSSSPLSAYEGGVVQAQAYGNFYNENHTYARSSSTQKDPRPGGDSVYVQTQYQYYVDLFSSWVDDDKRQTTRTNVNVWKDYYVRDPLRASRDRVRGIMKVCEDQTASGDPCSANVILGFSYS
jgi:hypothetical protein